MKKFLFHLLEFLLILFIIACGMDALLSSRLRHNTNRIYAAWNQMYADSVHYDLVVNGASEVWRGYNPIILDSLCGVNSFICGFDGSGINRQILKYHKLCSLHGQPSLLIQSLDIGALSPTYGYDREQYFPYFFYDRELLEMVSKEEHFSWVEKYVPCARYLGYYDCILEALLCTNRKYFHEDLYKGFCASDSHWDGTLLAQIDTITFCLDSTSLCMLKDFISEQTQLGTQVVLSYAPMYIKAQQKVTNLSEAYDSISNIAQSCGAYVLNYYDWNKCQDSSYFYNATHLNRIGAEKFSRQLANDIDSLQLIRFSTSPHLRR